MATLSGPGNDPGYVDCDLDCNSDTTTGTVYWAIATTRFKSLGQGDDPGDVNTDKARIIGGVGEIGILAAGQGVAATTNSDTITGLAEETEYFIGWVQDDTVLAFTLDPASSSITGTGVTATATVAASTPTLDHYYGIWPDAATPSDADVKAGTGATVTIKTTLGATQDTVESYAFSGLSDDTAYKIHWLGEDGNATQVRGTADAFATPDITVPVITNVDSSAIGTTTATITWDTDEDADSWVEYGIGDYASSSTLDPTMVQPHSVDLTGLTEDSTYQYRVTSEDDSNNSATLAGTDFDTGSAIAYQPVTFDYSTWIVTTGTVTSAGADSGPGTGVTAYRFQDDDLEGSSGTTMVQKVNDPLVELNTPYTFRAYVKPDQAQYIALFSKDIGQTGGTTGGASTSLYVFFDTADGSITHDDTSNISPQPASVKVEPYIEGWYFVELTFTNNNDKNAAYGFLPNDVSGTRYTYPDGTFTFWMCGAELVP